jgi:mRNA interferase RelE/StbE
MIYELGFLDSALKEWRKLDENARAQLKKKLAERLIAPHVSGARLSGSANRYKIKLRSASYRLVYEVREAKLVIIVVAIGKRERGEVYRAAQGRGVV